MLKSFFYTRKTDLGYQVIEAVQHSDELLSERIALNFLAHWSQSNNIARDLNIGIDRLGIQHA